MYKRTVFYLLIIPVFVFNSVLAKSDTSSNNSLSGFSQKKSTNKEDFCEIFASTAGHLEFSYHWYNTLTLYEKYSNHKGKCEDVGGYSASNQVDTS